MVADLTFRRPLARVALASLVLAPIAVLVPVQPACAAGQIRMSVVVDFGDLPNPPPMSAACVSAEEGSTGAAVLAARAKQLGTPAPRFNTSGLLCAIDGMPATGCGERTSDGYRYWSYWQGTASGWSYANVGPAERRVRPTQTEGWHFVEGAGLPSDPPPRGPADPSTTCRPAPSATTFPPPSSPGPTNAPGSPPPPQPGQPAVAPVPGAVTATTTTSTTVAGAVVDGTTTTALAGSEVAGASARRGLNNDDGGGGSRAVGTAVGLGAALALAGAGGLVARRRRG